MPPISSPRPPAAALAEPVQFEPHGRYMETHARGRPALQRLQSGVRHINHLPAPDADEVDVLPRPPVVPPDRAADLLYQAQLSEQVQRRVDGRGADPGK